MEYFLLFLLIGVVLAGLFYSRADFEIRLVRGEVSFRGRIPKARYAEITEFIDQQFPDRKKLTIRGRKDANGRLTLKFKGIDTPGESQQIRNFLLAVL